MVSERLQRFLGTKPLHWKRRLVQRPWLLPMVAMHLAALRVQRAWRRSWLKCARPSAIGDPASPAPPAPPAPPVSPANAPAPPLPPGPSEERVRARDQLRRRHVEHLRQCMVAQDGRPMYDSFESFCMAVIQGWWRSRIHLWRAQRVHSFLSSKVHQVAAFEIQQAWRSRHGRSVQSSYMSEHDHLVKYAKRLSEAAKKIQRKWRGHRDTHIYGTLRETIAMFRRSGDPYLLLRAVLARESVLLDPALQLHVRFRLGGPSFPPSIFYKIYTHGNVVDLGAFAPRDYHHERVSAEQKFIPDLGWYRRVENNGWRPLAVRLQEEKDKEQQKVVTAPKGFHHSKLRRRQDMEVKRRKRKIEWFQKLYGLHPNEDSPSASEGPTPRRHIVDEPEVDDDRLLDWTRKLDFDAYMESWQSIATTDGSEGTLPITWRSGF
ncbi:unnamed protein product [Effrenium voratum]|uniref:Uncharacterized protein n=1 Tax=Effrenium voratum TaxID=2562239 RepID=A0AA36J2P9_9DINO|nr:unnamed protein product [Effrenium voratum]CAJ1444951.1 unnamed protein product [Effrenium voratum]